MYIRLYQCHTCTTFLRRRLEPRRVYKLHPNTHRPLEGSRGEMQKDSSAGKVRKEEGGRERRGFPERRECVCYAVSRRICAFFLFYHNVHKDLRITLHSQLRRCITNAHAAAPKEQNQRGQARPLETIALRIIIHLASQIEPLRL